VFATDGPGVHFHPVRRLTREDVAADEVGYLAGARGPIISRSLASN
jgi:hypothetical protein